MILDQLLAEGREIATVPEIGRTVFGVGKSEAYELARRGAIPTLKLGDRRVVVPIRALIKTLETPPNATNAVPASTAPSTTPPGGTPDDATSGER